MYNNVRAMVRSGAKVTDYINCTRGVKQGDVCSPVLFSLFISEFALEIIENGRHGTTLTPDVIVLFILLLADDIVFFSETPVGLHIQLNSLHRAACTYHQHDMINMKKSNIVVFRQAGYLAARGRWFFDGEMMPVVNSCKYLRVYFSTRLSFGDVCQDLASRAKNALLCTLQKIYMPNNNSLEVYLKLFDAQIQSLAQNGAELWGLDKTAMHIEKCLDR